MLIAIGVDTRLSIGADIERCLCSVHELSLADCYVMGVNCIGSIKNEKLIDIQVTHALSTLVGKCNKLEIKADLFAAVSGNIFELRRKGGPVADPKTALQVINKDGMVLTEAWLNSTQYIRWRSTFELTDCPQTLVEEICTCIASVVKKVSLTDQYSKPAT